MSAQPAATVRVQLPLSAEDRGRADIYALLARLLHAAPDARLLNTLALAPPLDGEPALSKAWADLVAASAAFDAEAALDEFEALFGGVGRARVSVFAGFYASDSLAQHPRVKLIADMAALGLSRQAGSTEPEDHFAAVLDVMRILGAGGAGRESATVAAQKAFFAGHLARSLPKFLVALEGAEGANYYRRVAAFARAFAAIEQQSFELD
jgi:TorA maturation chaperone TorD